MVHIEYSTYQFSEESKGGYGIPPPPPGPYGTEKSVVLRGLNMTHDYKWYEVHGYYIEYTNNSAGGK